MSATSPLGPLAPVAPNPTASLIIVDSYCPFWRLSRIFLACAGAPAPGHPPFPNRHIPPIPVPLRLAWQAAKFNERGVLMDLLSRTPRSLNRGDHGRGLLGLAGKVVTGRGGEGGGGTVWVQMRASLESAVQQPLWGSNCPR